MTIIKNIQRVVQEELDLIKKRLIERGVDESVISECFYGNEQYTPTEKTPQDFSGGEVIFVKNYTKNSHALFGDFRLKQYREFKDTYLKQNAKFNPKLRFGVGWIVYKDEEKVRDFSLQLKKYNIRYREVEYEKYNEEIKQKMQTKVQAINIDDNISEIDVPDIEEEPPCLSPTSINLSKNKWGNETDDNDIVFKNIPIGYNGSLELVAIGVQDTEPEDGDEELDAVLPFYGDYEDYCKTKNYKILTRDMIENIQKYDNDLSEALQEIMDIEIDTE